MRFIVKDRRKREWIRAEDHTDQVPQENTDPDGSDQTALLNSIDQGTESSDLNQETNQHTYQNCNRNRQPHRQTDTDMRDINGERADHHHITLSKV